MTMDTLKTLLTDLRRADIKLRLEGNQLKYRAPGRIAPALRERIVALKPEIMVYLERLPGSNSAEPATIPRAAPDAVPQLSFSQQRLWFLEQLQESPSGTFNLFAALKLTGKLDHHALKASFGEVVRRHETPFMPR